ncbi:hypothetical protein [uncultured Fusobacterium sp.]|uniref:hypothetical protein n=1 Tax=uncultured Fusobacterium sp. TaxID=159267 RepID=UPI0025DB4223|nr:hypothetical protein [uncultured Fusobacterium sp.]
MDIFLIILIILTTLLGICYLYFSIKLSQKMSGLYYGIYTLTIIFSKIIVPSKEEDKK